MLDTISRASMTSVAASLCSARGKIGKMNPINKNCSPFCWYERRIEPNDPLLAAALWMTIGRLLVSLLLIPLVVIYRSNSSTQHATMNQQSSTKDSFSRYFFQSLPRGGRSLSSHILIQYTTITLLSFLNFDKRNCFTHKNNCFPRTLYQSIHNVVGAWKLEWNCLYW